MQANGRVLNSPIIVNSNRSLSQTLRNNGLVSTSLPQSPQPEWNGNGNGNTTTTNDKHSTSFSLTQTPTTTTIQSPIRCFTV